MDFSTSYSESDSSSKFQCNTQIVHLSIYLSIYLWELNQPKSWWRRPWWRRPWWRRQRGSGCCGCLRETDVFVFPQEHLVQASTTMKRLMLTQIFVPTNSLRRWRQPSSSTTTTTSMNTYMQISIVRGFIFIKLKLKRVDNIVYILNCLSIYLSIYISIYLSIYLTIYLFINYLSIYISINT